MWPSAYRTSVRFCSETEQCRTKTETPITLPTPSFRPRWTCPSEWDMGGQDDLAREFTNIQRQAEEIEGRE
jgi:hypothetical protein